MQCLIFKIKISLKDLDKKKLLGISPGLNILQEEVEPAGGGGAMFSCLGIASHMDFSMIFFGFLCDFFWISLWNVLDFSVIFLDL